MTKEHEALKLALEALESNKQTHYYCEDTWYSCPQHEDGCANDSVGDECNCGADKANAEIDKTMTAIREALAQPEQNEFNPDWDAMAVMVEEQQRMAKRIAELEAQQQEPVAWLHTKIEGVAVPHRPADLDKHPDRWEALYKTPPPCPTCEALARTVMLDQTYHDAQRKPLTDEEIHDCFQQRQHRDRVVERRMIARAIERAHGIGGEE